MISTLSLIEIQSIVDVLHGDPHHALGMHEGVVDGEKVLIVRAFMPKVKSICVFDPLDAETTYEMQKIHVDGFFECIIKDRKEWFRYKFDVEDYEGCRWQEYDPYSFESVISDVDMHLFVKGTHYEIYEKLGAHVMEIDGVKGIYFAVWAPNAKRVSVIGDFNNWDGCRHAMRFLQDAGIWEIFIPSAAQFDKYKFEIRTIKDDVINKADPYGNYCELRPDTASVIYDINQYKWNDENWIKSQSKRDKYNRPMNIYEVHLGSWKHMQEEDSERFLTYMELADKLVEYVIEMGYTHIELMPVEEHPFDGSWGYQVTGYFAPTSRYGTPDEFMYFVDKCHQNGIGVFLDWVPAHFPKDAHGLARFDGTALYEHQDPRQGEHPEWGTLIFNFGRSEVKNFLYSNALFWIEKYHIDGLRVDAVASMLYLDYGKKDGEWVANKYGGNGNLEAVEFLKHMNSIVEKKFPNAYMIAEESTAWPKVSKPVEDDGLGFDLKWNMGWMNDFLEYASKECEYRKYHHHNIVFGMVYAYSENFVLVLSHDEVVHGKRSMLDKMPGDLWQKFANLRVSYGFMFGHPGKKLLFMGGEFGQFIEWNENKELDWFLLEFEHHKALHDYVKDLNHLYLNEPAFWKHDFTSDGFEWLDKEDDEKSIVSFIRKGNKRKDTLVVICNFTPIVYEDFKQGMPFAGQYEEVFNSDDPKYGGSGVVNEGKFKTKKSECHKKDNSIRLRIPPLGITILKPL